MYLKFGFGRATQDVGIEIRRGAMTRDQGINLANLYDNHYPEEFIDQYLKYYPLYLKFPLPFLLFQIFYYRIFEE